MTQTVEEVRESAPITYEVVIGYCDGTSFPHPHRVNTLAVEEYTQLWQIAAEDHEAQADVPRHIRQVHMLVYDVDSGVLRSHIDTGVFPCRHRR